MGKKIKISANKNLANNWDVGTEVFIQYSCLHDEFGILTTPAPAPHLSGQNVYWDIHWQAAKQYFEKCKEFDREIFEIPENKLPQSKLGNKSRYVPEELSYTLYITATEMCLHTIISVEHFANNLYQYISNKIENFDFKKTDEKLRITTKELLNIDIVNDTAYTNDFQKILNIRHEISHPSKVFNYARLTIEQTWDEIPMNWFLSGRALKSFEGWKMYYENLLEKFQQYLASLPKVQTKINNVQRGIQFNHDFKKNKP